MSLIKKLYTLISVIFILGFISCINDDIADWSLPLGSPLPSFTLIMSDGSTLNSTSLMGEECMVIFFDPSCPDCFRELPIANEVYEADGVHTVCISRAGTDSEIAAMWEELNLTMPRSAGADMEVYRSFARSGVPRAFIFDSKGLLTVSLLEDFSGMNNLLKNPNRNAMF